MRPVSSLPVLFPALPILLFSLAAPVVVACSSMAAPAPADDAALKVFPTCEVPRGWAWSMNPTPCEQTIGGYWTCYLGCQVIAPGFAAVQYVENCLVPTEEAAASICVDHCEDCTGDLFPK